MQTAFLRPKSTSQIPQTSLDLSRCLGRIPLLLNDFGKHSQWIEGYSTRPSTITQLRHFKTLSLACEKLTRSVLRRTPYGVLCLPPLPLN